jgi:hypothetical protein
MSMLSIHVLSTHAVFKESYACKLSVLKSLMFTDLIDVERISGMVQDQSRDHAYTIELRT